MRPNLGWVAVVALGVGVSCAQPLRKLKPGKSVVDIEIDRVDPDVWLPGTSVQFTGSGFYPDIGGATSLHLDGRVGNRVVEVELPVRFVDYDHVELDWPGLDALGINGEGDFDGLLWLSTDAVHDGKEHASPKQDRGIAMVRTVEPVVVEVDADVRHVNDPIVLRGDGFLLGGDEGSTWVTVEGCFRDVGGGGCNAVDAVALPAVPTLPGRRDEVVVAFSPDIAGISRGDFEGTFRVANRLGDGRERALDGAFALDASIGRPQLVGLAPLDASLGQFVDVVGAGFVGPTAGDGTAATLVELEGTLARGGPRIDIDVTLVPEFVEGGRVRYVLNEEDGLGRELDLRAEGADFSGTATAIVVYGNDEVAGDAVPVAFTIAPVKQVVYLRFLPNFVESLRHFGLRAAEGAIVDRIVEVVERDYRGVNVEVRLEPPEDFALYAEVEISGPDPNGLGLLGYDNTPGKDVGNQRLYDKIGGVNALTQLDGYPGFGGVFIESLFSFSSDPGGFAAPAEADPLFDRLFDPFRPDRGGRSANAGEVADAPRGLSNTDCPSTGRSKQLGCAIFALGNLIGTTVSHEIAHSVGLADPDGEAFHNTGDWENALMDGGSYRTFAERAEVDGQGPGVFCDGAYSYLRGILPTEEPDPLGSREECY